MTDEAAAIVDTTPAVITPDAPVTSFDSDAEMDKVWNRLQVNNGADRAEDGKFQSPDQEKRAAAEAANQAPLEGGEGEEQPVAAAVTDVPLPANWKGKDELWAKLAPDVRAEIAEHQKEQHAQLSDYGRLRSVYGPIEAVVQEFGDYFKDGRLKMGDGSPLTPAAGMAYLFNIQRQMDTDPVNTALNIIDTYGIRDQLAAALGAKAPNGTANPDPAARENLLLQKIDRLEARLAQAADPSRVEQVVEEKISRTRFDEEVSRMAKAKPLYDRIDPDDMVFQINKAWKKLGNDAPVASVFDHAYNAAIEADPALRALAKAANAAAEDTAAKAVAAKKASSVNVKSSSAGKPRALTDDEALEQKWAELH